MIAAPCAFRGREPSLLLAAAFSFSALTFRSHSVLPREHRRDEPLYVGGTEPGFVILNRVPLPQFQTMSLGRRPRPFSHPDWLFEIKWDGFRSLVHAERGECKLISRNGNEFKSFAGLNQSLPAELRSKSAVLDGEIVCLDEGEKPQFRDLLFRRDEPRFVAFDLLWLDGEDLDTSLVIQTRMTVYPSLYPAFYRPRPLWRSFPPSGISQQRIPEESLPAFVIANPVGQIFALGKET